MLLLLSDEEWRKRLETCTQKEEWIVPEYVLLEMRAKFIIPAKGDFLKDVLYAELGLGRERENRGGW